MSKPLKGRARRATTLVFLGHSPIELDSPPDAPGTRLLHKHARNAKTLRVLRSSGKVICSEPGGGTRLGRSIFRNNALLCRHSRPRTQVEGQSMGLMQPIENRLLAQRPDDENSAKCRILGN
jgi:hypothetical protein